MDVLSYGRRLIWRLFGNGVRSAVLAVTIVVLVLVVYGYSGNNIPSRDTASYVRTPQNSEQILSNLLGGKVNKHEIIDVGSGKLDINKLLGIHTTSIRQPRYTGPSTKRPSTINGFLANLKKESSVAKQTTIASIAVSSAASIQHQDLQKNMRMIMKSQQQIYEQHVEDQEKQIHEQQTQLDLLKNQIIKQDMGQTQSKQSNQQQLSAVSDAVNRYQPEQPPQNQIVHQQQPIPQFDQSQMQAIQRQLPQQQQLAQQLQQQIPSAIQAQLPQHQQQPVLPQPNYQPELPQASHQLSALKAIPQDQQQLLQVNHQQPAFLSKQGQNQQQQFFQQQPFPQQQQQLQPNKLDQSQQSIPTGIIQVKPMMATVNQITPLNLATLPPQLLATPPTGKTSEQLGQLFPKAQRRLYQLFTPPSQPLILANDVKVTAQMPKRVYPTATLKTQPVTAKK